MELNVLVVDDKEVNLISTEALLEELKCNVIKASSGSKALKLLLEKKVALILMDVNMPEMDGFETAELIRGNDRMKNIPIIFITALNADQRQIFNGYELGAIDFILKPIWPSILLSKVKIFLNIKTKEFQLMETLNTIEEKNKELEKALSEIQTLKGLLPICCNCKKIRNDKGYWENIENYFSEHTDIIFSHGLCNVCAKDWISAENIKKG